MADEKKKVVKSFDLSAYAQSMYRVIYWIGPSHFYVQIIRLFKFWFSIRSDVVHSKNIYSTTYVFHVVSNVVRYEFVFFPKETVVYLLLFEQRSWRFPSVEIKTHTINWWASKTNSYTQCSYIIFWTECVCRRKKRFLTRQTCPPRGQL